MMAKKYQLAELQLALMQVLWERGEATVAEVRDALADERPLAYTTVSTMLTKMERKGQVKHRNEGRVLVYQPAVREQTVSRSMVTDLATRLFGGNVTQMVSHLLDGCDVDPDELARLRLLIREKEKEAKDAQ
jgi:BlaI family transcriptional regulator, penicillinase repressor